MSKIYQTRLIIRFQSGASNVNDLKAELASALEELADPGSDLARLASGIGIAAREFADARGSVDQEGKGFGDVVVIIAIFAPAANHALRNVWDEVIWPRLKSRLGADAVGEELEGADSDQDDSDQDDSDQDDSERLCPILMTSGAARKPGSAPFTCERM
jgi:hypothetical protein